MRVLRLLVAMSLLSLPGMARAQERPAIRAFPIAAIEQLGLQIARRDAAAWVATDALQARVPDLRAAGVRGWLVTDTAGGHQRVRFTRDVGRGLEAGWDIDVGPDLKTALSEPTDRKLSAEDLAQFEASRTAGAALQGQPVCRPGYNQVTLKDPEGDGWIVWLLAPMPEMGAIPIGGHYRVSVSADGRNVTRRDALSASCMVLPKLDPKAGQPAAAVATHIVSPTPLETHVFLQLQSRRPMYVMAGDHMWSIDRGKIRDQGPMKDFGKGAKSP